MEILSQPKLAFRGVDIVKIDFKSSHFLKSETQNISLVINPKVFYPSNEPLSFKIIMEVNLEAEECFGLEFIAVGTFELADEIDENLKKAFVNSNAPAIMFPYIRSFISTLTANLGNIVSSITIPTQFFQGELEIVSEPN